MRGIVVLLALLAAGCGGDSYVRLSSSGSPTTGVSTGISTGGSVYVQGSTSSSTFAALLAIGILAGASYASDQRQQGIGMSYRGSPFMAGGRSVPVPELDATRRVNEQDCSKPIEDWSANLKCK
jgi:hypothetical protein